MSAFSRIFRGAGNVSLRKVPKSFRRRESLAVIARGDSDAIRHRLDHAPDGRERDAVRALESRGVERRGADDELVLLAAHGGVTRAHAFVQRHPRLERR